ncbi:hypothetical protein [Kribbella sp. CA-294648]|uniref:hypothetical protein n=1 Tax=Kribbella sp. CA-294648 TaxID=3239948 RepID=UPI003D8BB423
MSVTDETSLEVRCQPGNDDALPETNNRLAGPTFATAMNLVGMTLCSVRRPGLACAQHVRSGTRLEAMALAIIRRSIVDISRRLLRTNVGLSVDPVLDLSDDWPSMDEIRCGWRVREGPQLFAKTGGRRSPSGLLRVPFPERDRLLIAIPRLGEEQDRSSAVAPPPTLVAPAEDKTFQLRRHWNVLPQELIKFGDPFTSCRQRGPSKQWSRHQRFPVADLTAGVIRRWRTALADQLDSILAPSCRCRCLPACWPLSTGASGPLGWSARWHVALGPIALIQYLDNGRERTIRAGRADQPSSFETTALRN